MNQKQLVATVFACALSAFSSTGVFAEGRMFMDWSPIRDPAKAALESGKADKDDEFKTQVKQPVLLTDEMNSKQADGKLDVAYWALTKIRDEPNVATATKMLEELIPTLVDWWRRHLVAQAPLGPPPARASCGDRPGMKWPARSCVAYRGEAAGKTNVPEPH